MSSRIFWIDILKAFAIWTVVVGHMVSCEAFASQIGRDFYQEIILAFHMPLFTVLSGWFFSAKRTAWDFLKTKGISILLPYVVWGSVWFWAMPLISAMMAGQEVHLSTIVWQTGFYLNEGLLCYGWWFLRGLFLTSLLAYVSVKIAERCGTAKTYLWGGLVSTMLLYGLTFAGVIPNQPEKDSLLKGFIYMYPFFWAGYGFRQVWQRYADRMLSKRCMVAVWLLFLMGLIFWNGETDSFYAMNTSVVTMEGAHDIVGGMVVYKTFFRYVVGVAGSLSFILLFERLFSNDVQSKDHQSKDHQNKMRLFCQNIGKETLGIYILQSLVYWSLPGHDLLGWGEAGNFCFALLLSCVIVIVAYWMIRITSRNKWLGLLLWGKKPAETRDKLA